MAITQVFPEHYPAQLQQKQAKLCALLAPFNPPALAVHPSPPSHYRMRAEFRVWHDNERVFYAMQDPDQQGKLLFLEQFPVANRLINQLMTKLLAILQNEPLLRKRLFQVEFLTSTQNEAVITLVYHRKLDDDWRQKAARAELLLGAAIIGRSRGQKIITSRDNVTEVFEVGGRTFVQRQPESAFSQPNATVNQHMLEWSYRCCEGLGGDLLELYCGNGNFTLPLSHQFRKVLATEVSKTATAAALHNIRQNQCDNITLVRLSSEELTQALNRVRPFRRLAEVDLASYHFSTVMVDPPRAGLDPATLALVSTFNHILYVSCNPDTLCENLGFLDATHSISQLALFDQFPYTHHMECGVFLTRR